MGAVDKDWVDKGSPMDTWAERYSLAYIDVAKRQLGQLQQGLRAGSIHPSATDAARMNVALDEVARQVTSLRYLRSDITAQLGQYRR